MRKRRFISLMALVAVLLTLVMVVGLSIVAFAAETAEEVVAEYPWANTVVLGVQWGVLVSVIISLLKLVPAVAEKPKIILIATWTLGFIGLVLYGLFNGQSVGLALLGGLVAVTSAPGFYEAFSKPLGKKFSSGSGSA